MILIVDDEPDLLAVSSAYLREDGHAVLTASSGSEALEVLAAEEPELILCDVRMPVMGGFELREAYTRQHPTRSTPFVFMTSLGDPDHIVRGLDSGADDYLVKPVPPGVLRARVRALLRSRTRWSAPSFRGDLARFPFIKVVRFCELHALTGLVDFEAPGFRVVVPFRAGRLEMAGADADASLAGLYDATEGTFTIRSRPVDFDELASAAAPPEGTREGPAGRLSVVEAPDGSFDVQTELGPGTNGLIVTVAQRAGQTVLKRVTEPPAGATRGELEARVEIQHAAVEHELRERTSTPAFPAPPGHESAGERFDRLFEAGFAAYRAQDYEGALTSWEEAERLCPQDKAVGVNLRVVREKLARMRASG